MAAAKSTARVAPPGRRMPRLQLSTKTLVVAGLTIAAAVYGFLFLGLPVSDGIVDADGRPISRAGLVLSALLYPEGLIASWTDAGRLPAGFLDRLPVATATLLWLGLAVLVGLSSVAAVGREKDAAARVERFSLAALAGLAMLSTVVLLIGLAGGLHSRWPLLLACGTLAALAAAAALLMRRRVSASASASVSTLAANEQSPWALDDSRGLFDRGLQWMAIALTCWLATVIMLGAWVPSAEFDVMEYHLQAPKEFFQQGAIRFLPHNIYANMPLGAEMHTLAMMTIAQEPDAWFPGLMGKSILAAITLLGAALLGAFVARRFGASMGWSAAGIWLATPGIAQNAMLGLVDGVVATYVLAAAVAVAYAFEATAALGSEPAAQSIPLRSTTLNGWWLAGLFSGAAAATKYPGLLFAVVPVCASLPFAFKLFPFAGRLGQRIDGTVPVHSAPVRSVLARSIALVVIGLAATCGTWYAKNWALAGNPVYPLAANIFGGKTLSPAKIAQWQRAHRAPLSSAPGAAERLVRGARAAAEDVLRLTIASPFVQPAMICGLILAIGLVLRHRQVHQVPWLHWLIWSLWIAGVWWFATHRIDRFWLPLTGLWAGLAAMGLHALRRDGSPWLAHAIVILGLGYGSLLNSTSLVSDSRYFVSVEALRDDRGDETQVPRISQEQAWINEHLTANDSSVLLIGEARVFEYRVPILYSTCFDTNPGETLLRGRSPAEQLAALHERGITHIMVNWSEIARYRSVGNYGFSDWPQPSDLQRLIDNGVAVKVDWGIADSSATLLRVK